MKILVCPHELAMGGSQINAIELAGALKRLGHDVVVHAPDGILASFVADQGLPLVSAPGRSSVVSLRAIGALSGLARRGRFDLIHAYEWAPSIRATFGPHLRWKTPTVMTVLSMDVPDFLPTHLPLIVGTRGLADAERARRGRVHLIEPPIDTDLNATADVPGARATFGFGEHDLVLSVVCRLSTDLDKLAGVLEAIDVVDGLAESHLARLLVVGDGEGLAEVRAAADAVNSKHDDTVVVVTGPLLDPRPAYDAADIVLGMGSSALKGMSFSRPTVVQGTAGFWRLLEEASLEGFLQDGWFGHGGAGGPALRAILIDLAGDVAAREELGRFGREIVESRFSLHLAAQALNEIYLAALSDPTATSGRRASLARSAFEVAKFRLVMTARRILSARRGSVVPA